MGKKIFISYKYADQNVYNITNNILYGATPRDYVDKIQEKLEVGDHINKGEDDDEDMSSLSDSTIASKLGDKIYDSTVTVVLVSKGMKENKSEKEQWIPWEISYSLREQSRNGQKSKTNAIIAVILPDTSNNYSYYMNYSQQCDATIFYTNIVFPIIKKNMFNTKNMNTRECNGRTIYMGPSSYVVQVKWIDYINNMDLYIENALENYRNRDNFEIVKALEN